MSYYYSRTLCVYRDTSYFGKDGPKVDAVRRLEFAGLKFEYGLDAGVGRSDVLAWLTPEWTTPQGSDRPLPDDMKLTAERVWFRPNHYSDVVEVSLEFRLTQPRARYGYGSGDAKSTIVLSAEGADLRAERTAMNTLLIHMGGISGNIDCGCYSHASGHACALRMKWVDGQSPDDGWLLLTQPVGDVLVEDGVKQIKKQPAVASALAVLADKYPVENAVFRYMHSAETMDKTTPNQLLKAFLVATKGDVSAMVAGLRKAMKAVESGDLRVSWQTKEFRNAFCRMLPGAEEKISEAEKRATWYRQKTNKEQADALGIDPAKFPKLAKAVETGAVALSAFHQPNKAPVNTEFALIERAFNREGWQEVLERIMTDAGRRSTYDKDVTPYIGFLFRIEKYLDRMVPGPTPWRAIPKYVESQWELEMTEATEEGTTKRRSAFTPVADNAARTVTVPYVAMAVGGARTQWCYSMHYTVFEEGIIDAESNTVVTSDFEEKLNGRDDYGLMYFTLTGTVTSRGYPTFLIIFERLASGTRVHFHRVHPSRTRGVGGGATRASDLVRECYRYMAGNVEASEIEAQQGDLLFIRLPGAPASIGEAKPVKSFESHAFVTNAAPVLLHEGTAKTQPKNRLGYLFAATDFSVQHPEHENIEGMKAGWWEVRRCKSWEANPRAIWSLMVD